MYTRTDRHRNGDDGRAFLSVRVYVLGRTWVGGRDCVYMQLMRFPCCLVYKYNTSGIHTYSALCVRIHSVCVCVCVIMTNTCIHVCVWPWYLLTRSCPRTHTRSLPLCMCVYVYMIHVGCAVPRLERGRCRCSQSRSA